MYKVWWPTPSTFTFVTHTLVVQLGYKVASRQLVYILSPCHAVTALQVHCHSIQVQKSFDLYYCELSPGVPLGIAPLSLHDHHLPDPPWSPQWSSLGFALPCSWHIPHARRGQSAVKLVSILWIIKPRCFEISHLKKKKTGWTVLGSTSCHAPHPYNPGHPGKTKKFTLWHQK